MPRPRDVALYEVPDVLGHRVACDVAAIFDYLCDIPGNVIGPMLQRVEGHDPNRVVELPRQKIIDDVFKIGPLDLGLPVDAALPRRSTTR